MSWWGLQIDGELVAVIRADKQPTVYDFNEAIWGGSSYEVVPVRVEVLA